MTYTDAATLKTYLGISSSSDDTLLTALIARAQAAIDAYTGRTFEHGATATDRYYTVGVDTDGATLYLDKDLCSISAVVTDADDGSGGTAIPSGSYFTEPLNDTPYFAIKIAGSTTYAWEYTNNPQKAIKVTGKWAYSTTPPADIVQAAIRWAAYMYRQKDAGVFDVTALPGQGQMMIPQGIPADVKILLASYRRIV